jgi:hypothetical protein
MLAVARGFLDEKAPGAEMDLLLGSTAGHVPAAFDAWPRHTWFMPSADTQPWPRRLLEELHHRKYDTVVFLYPDAIGTDWRKVERRLVGLKADRYLIINGRRRVFFWDEESRGALAWRRFLERTWLTELLLVPAAVCVTAGLALFDALGKVLARRQEVGG